MYVYFISIAIIMVGMFIFSLKSKNSVMYTKEGGLLKYIFIFFPALLIGYYYAAFKPIYSGGDTLNYYLAFNRMDGLLALGESMYGSELLFWPLQSIFKLFVDWRGWLFLNFTLVMFFSAIVYKKIIDDKNIALLVFVFVNLTYFIVYSGNVMRQAFALPFVMLALIYAYQNKRYKYIFFTLLAISFHWSSVIALLYPIYLSIVRSGNRVITVPLVALLFSPVAYLFIDYIVNIFGIDIFEKKASLYVNLDRDSHVGNIWEKFNFWYCVVISYSFFFYRGNKYGMLASILSFFMAIILFTIFVTDISERHFPYVIFLTPIALVLILEEINIKSAYKNLFFVCFFVFLSILVMTRESTKVTLGI